jgi:pimeloyl-ACP methyl ester carboxylesterase
MATFVLIPGAGGVAWYWHRVVPLLAAGGHTVVPVELPGDDERATLRTYADRVVAAINGRSDLVVVAQSLGGFTAPLVCERVPVRMLVLVNAMIPQPGETASEWSEHTGSTAARIAAAERGGYSTEFDLAIYFLHDVPADVAAAGEAHQRPQADAIFADRCEFARWPETLHVIAGRDDRLFPLEFQQRVAADRLGAQIDVIGGGHLVALSNPRALAAQLVSYLQ